MSPSLLPRLLLLGVVVVAVPALGACNQDSYSSSSTDRETHMGDTRAAAPPASSAPAPTPPAAPPVPAASH